MSRILTRKGFTCHEAENGQECVNKVLNHEYPYDFILMDYPLEILEGPAVARCLRENNCDILIIGLTGHVMQEDIDYFCSQGANFVLPKPLNVDNLLEKVRLYQSQTHSSS